MNVLQNVRELKDYVFAGELFVHRHEGVHLAVYSREDMS